ncbi:MAG: hypothetical protein A3E25_10595 [Burkholderiales bacterium RIFCSPHIGHO2_12_FULL_69_20]|nr:MAG: hypothetical protein A3E25_10595 [Burkholderiales bacterium RIFCSPHIGHO2_12_FULL_69_20]
MARLVSNSGGLVDRSAQANTSAVDVNLDGAGRRDARRCSWWCRHQRRRAIDFRHHGDRQKYRSRSGADGWHLGLQVQPSPVEQQVGVDAGFLCNGRHRCAGLQAAFDQRALQGIGVPAPGVLALRDSFVHVCICRATCTHPSVRAVT